ncbi:oligosaccharide flippase family protein [Geminocystis herdmanii]|uniref:oligosaccharide flippase family protein n=1 Tax=Geminocystis herdmanii TaxID=669359 RepID=UPI000344919C|nr:oligosaccharide flippase family protein [Geminocystis herdmanii]
MIKKHSSDNYFDNSNVTNNLKQKTIKGGILTISSQGIKFILQTGSTIFLARLLTPQDYGIVGMVTVVLNFLNLFKDIGLSQATIQKSEITQAQVSNLFWVNVGISLLLSLFLFVSAPFIVSFYNEPRLLWITRVLAITFVVSGLALQHLALMKRQMLFEKIIFIDVGTQVFALTIGIVSALNGLGYWALVLMSVIPPFLQVPFTWLMCQWIPSLPSRHSGVKDMLNYGWNLTGFNVVNYFSRNLDNILIGRYWGIEALGLYAKAYQLLLLPIQQINAPISNVALPVLSKLQNEPERYKKFYYKMLLISTLVTMPIVGFFFVDADKIILLLLGKKWLEIVPIFKALVPAAYVGTLGISIGLVFNSLGKTRQQLILGIISSFSNVVVFIVTVPMGVKFLATWFSIFSVMRLIPTYIYCYQNTPLNLKDTLKILSYPSLSSLGGVLILTNIQNKFYIANPLISVLTDLILYFLLCFSILCIMPKGFILLRDIIKDFKT